MKSISQIVIEVEWLVETLGYREISLSSLSTGDYRDLVELVQQLTERFSKQGVSFSLPSLRVNSVTLPIFEAISRGKRSGLTFAIESADVFGQAAINKMVPLERVIEIAREARHRGWQHAKLYFMIGLPGSGDDSHEAEQIGEYVRRLRRAVPMEYVVNVGTFVPKPHTPLQWDRQLSAPEARARIGAIRSALPRGAKIRAGNPDTSWLEGIISRGTQETGDLIEAAFEQGARLDAWDEHANIPLWRSLAGSDRFRDIAQRALGPFEFDETLPWSSVELGVSQRHLRAERERAARGELTNRCAPGCDEPCGVCNRNIKVFEPRQPEALSERNRPDMTKGAQLSPQENGSPVGNGNGETPESGDQHGREYQLIINYTKTGSAAFLPHLALVRTFERVWNRTGIPIALTQGYHPKPKMSFGQPLPLGSESDDEVVIVNLQKSIHVESIFDAVEAALPDGFSILRMILLHHEKGSLRIPTPMQSYGGSRYHVATLDDDDAVFANVFGEFLVDGTDTVGTPPFENFRHAIYLPETAPGLGRLLKQVDRRDHLRAKRIAMYARDGAVRLVDFYARLPNCVADVSRPGEIGQPPKTSVAAD